MKEFNFFDITGNNPKLNWQNIHMIDLLPQEKKASFEQWLSKHKWLHTLNKWTSKKLVELFISNLWIETTNDFLQKLPNISFQVRKLIKDTKKDLVEMIDSPDFLPTYLYLLLGFSINSETFVSSNSQNNIKNLAWTILQLLQTNNISTETYFCAHRENKQIKKNTLVEQINENEFYRVKNLLHWIISNLPNIEKYTLNFYAIKWNLTGSVNVFPNILFSHFLRRELYKIPVILDKQFEHMSTLVNNENEKLFSTSEIDKTILENKNTISDSDIEFIRKEILLHFNRFEKEIQNFKQLNNLDYLTKLNLENANKFWKEELVQNIIKKVLDFDVLEKSVEEYLFYLNWGKMIAQNKNIALWFDRDHGKYQTLSFEKWFNWELAPILYARRTGKKSWVQINNLSFRQFWHYYD